MRWEKRGGFLIASGRYLVGRPWYLCQPGHQGLGMFWMGVGYLVMIIMGKTPGKILAVL
jgi:hypothetical protein